MLLQHWQVLSFRPLIGVNFCKRLFIGYRVQSVYSFRPLIGVNFCKQECRLLMRKCMGCKVFVPLSGLASVNKMNMNLAQELQLSVFVPLSGLASVNAKQNVVGGDPDNVFVPLSGLASVNYGICKKCIIV